MAQLDAFSAQIVKFVREMPDEALLDLIRQKLGAYGASGKRNGGGSGAARLAAALRGAPTKLKTKRPTSAKRRPARRAAAPSAERQAMLDSVEKVVKSSSGVSASDVARLANIPQNRAAAALKELKLAKRIFQGGDRRFARYAGDAKTAEQASSIARKTAKGPTVAHARSRTKKRASSTAEE
jgi:hypothetical protein